MQNVPVVVLVSGDVISGDVISGEVVSSVGGGVAGKVASVVSREVVSVGVG